MADGFGLIGNAIDSNIGGSGLDSFSFGGDTGLSLGGDYLSSADTSSLGGGFNLGSLPWGTIFNTLGRLGAGIGSGVSAYQSGNQANYIPITRWAGNGLAYTDILNNMANKQNQLNQAYGSGRALSSLLGQGFSLFGNNNLDTNLGNNDYNLKLEDYLGGVNNSKYDTQGNYSDIGNAIDKYIRG